MTIMSYVDSFNGKANADIMTFSEMAFTGPFEMEAEGMVVSIPTNSIVINRISASECFTLI